MNARGYTATFNDLVEVYSDEDINERLAYTFWIQLGHVLQELEVLMWRYQTQVTKNVYEREEVRHRLVEAWLASEANSVHILERSLKYLLGRRWALKAAVAVAEVGRAGRYQYQCQRTGVVKMYKQMSSREVKIRNAQLEAEASRCRWVAALERDHRPNENVHVGAGNG